MNLLCNRQQSFSIRTARRAIEESDRDRQTDRDRAKQRPTDNKSETVKHTSTIRQKDRGIDRRNKFAKRLRMTSTGEVEAEMALLKKMARTTD